MPSGPPIPFLPGVALALSADAVAPVVAEGGGGVVGPAAHLQVAVEAQVLRVALAPPAEEVRSALADPAHVRAVARALVGVLDETLEQQQRSTSQVAEITQK